MHLCTDDQQQKDRQKAEEQKNRQKEEEEKDAAASYKELHGSYKAKGASNGAANGAANAAGKYTMSEEHTVKGEKDKAVKVDALVRLVLLPLPALRMLQPPASLLTMPAGAMSWSNTELCACMS